MFSKKLSDLRGGVSAIGDVSQRSDSAYGLKETVLARIQWGHDGSYIEIKIEREYAAGSATGTWTVTVDPTYDTSDTTTGSTWEDVEVEWTWDDTMVSSKCTGDTVDMEGGEFAVTINGTPWRSWSSMTDTGYTYDEAKDRYSCGMPLWEYSNRPIADCSTVDDVALVADTYPTFGYERDSGSGWVEDYLHLVIIPPSNTGCTSYEEIPELEWLTSGSCEGRHWTETTITIPGAHTVECHCPPGYTETQSEIDSVHLPNDIDRDFGIDWIHMTPATSDLYDWEYEATYQCYAIEDGASSVVTESGNGIDPWARCGYEGLSISNINKTLFCIDRLQEMLCILPPPLSGPESQDPCTAGDDYGYFYYGTSEMTVSAPTCVSNGGEPWSLIVPFGPWYEEISGLGGYVLFSHWSFGTPIGAPAWTSVVDSSTHSRYGRIAYDHMLRRYAIFAYGDGASVKLKISDDDGVSWRSEEVLFVSANYPDIEFDEADRWLVSAAFKYVSGSSGPGNIYVKYMPPDTGTWTSEFTVNDETDTPIEFEATTFKFRKPDSMDYPWILVAVPYGETERAHYRSSDDLVSFKRL